MAKAKPAQTEVAQDETVQAATEDQVTTSEQPTAAPEAPAQDAAQTDTAPVATVAPEVTPTADPVEPPAVDTYTREDGVRVTALPGGTVREDY